VVGALTRLARLPLARRLGRSLLVAFGVMCVAFGLIRFVPGDPVLLLLGDLATPESVAQLRGKLGLDRGLPEQFVGYALGIARGDLGRSISTDVPVTSTVGRTLPVTLWLIGTTMTIGLALALPLAVLAALHRRGPFGQVFRVGTSVLLATPTFFSGLLGILLFSIQLGLAPVAGYEPAFPGNLWYLWLPALVTCTVLVPILARVLQSSIVDTMEQEFVESAVVRGLPRRLLVWRYLLRPSLAPTIGLLGYMIGQMLAAVVIVEIIFGLPGVGTALMDAVLGRDYPVVQGIVFVLGMIVVIVNFLADTVSGWVDPRTRTT
jgi:peptide/nickel transport system permease protein